MGYLFTADDSGGQGEVTSGTAILTPEVKMQKVAECQNSIPAKDVIVGKFQVEDDKENRKVRPTTNGDETNAEVPGESRESPRTAERSHRGVTFDLSVNQQEETKHRKASNKRKVINWEGGREGNSPQLFVSMGRI